MLGNVIIFQDAKCSFHDDGDDIMDEDKRDTYANMPANKRLTMKYDMSALKKIGEYEDTLREKLGIVFSCDPDELPIDLDLNDIYAMEPEDRKGALVSSNCHDCYHSVHSFSLSLTVCCYGAL